MMEQDKLVTRELVSALVDGQLRGAEFASVVASVAGSEDALLAWHGYHVIGDALRSADLAACQGDQAFVARLRGRLNSAVQTGLFPAYTPGGLPLSAEPPVVRGRAAPADSANDAVTRWKLISGVASMAAVAALGWHLLSDSAGLSRPVQLAAVPGATVAAAVTQPGATAIAEPQVMLRDARLDELLAAHKQFGGTSALQMPAGFLRNATFESSSR